MKPARSSVSDRPRSRSGMPPRICGRPAALTSKPASPGRTWMFDLSTTLPKSYGPTRAGTTASSAAGAPPSPRGQVDVAGQPQRRAARAGDRRRRADLRVGRAVAGLGRVAEAEADAVTPPTSPAGSEISRSRSSCWPGSRAMSIDTLGLAPAAVVLALAPIRGANGCGSPQPAPPPSAVVVNADVGVAAATPLAYGDSDASLVCVAAGDVVDEHRLVAAVELQREARERHRRQAVEDGRELSGCRVGRDLADQLDPPAGHRDRGEDPERVGRPSAARGRRRRRARRAAACRSGPCRPSTPPGSPARVAALVEAGLGARVEPVAERRVQVRPARA